MVYLEQFRFPDAEVEFDFFLRQVSLDSMKDSGSVPKGIRLTGVRSVKDAMDAILK